MTRLPHGFPAPWFNADAGGAADLQTDVMRFMAILALCLVAIFALVQSVPIEPPPVAESRAADAPIPPTTAPPPVRVTAARAAPAPSAPVVPDPPVPSPAAVATPPAAPVPPAATPAPADDGFTLRFESGDALRSLVARGEVGLYAMRGSDARRLAFERGRPVFWTASMPSVFHEMEARTVPADIAASLDPTYGGDVRWGVTLPSRLSRDIERRLDGGGSGELVIAANGRLRRE